MLAASATPRHNVVGGQERSPEDKRAAMLSHKHLMSTGGGGMATWGGFMATWGEFMATGVELMAPGG